MEKYFLNRGKKDYKVKGYRCHREDCSSLKNLVLSGEDNKFSLNQDQIEIILDGMYSTNFKIVKKLVEDCKTITLHEIYRGCNKNGVDCTMLEVFPDEGITEDHPDWFIPFCVILYTSYSEGKFSYEEYIPKCYNSVTFDGKPYTNYNKNYTCREEILTQYFPETLKAIDKLLEDDYQEDEDYCMGLDQAFNLVWGVDTGIPKPEYNIEKLVETLNKVITV